jgi:hypothetical protein
MEKSFDPIAYLNGLTRFVFEKDALVNIAYENGLVGLTDRSQIDEYTKDHCLIALYELVINGPWSVASSSLQHGSYRQDVGSETVTAAIIQNLKDRLKALYKKYGEEDALESMNDGDMVWVNENSFDV